MAQVSVVVPVYNTEKYVGRLIESLLSQTLKDIEIILVDDGSSDSSGEICDSYGRKDSRIKVLHKKNGGVGAARNDGLTLAEGEWVSFCDSDDWLEENAFELLLRAAEETGADVALGDANLVYGSRIIENALYASGFVADSREKTDLMIAAVMSRNYCDAPPPNGPSNGGYGGAWNKLVKRELLVKNGIAFDTSLKGYFDDILYVANVYAHAEKIVYIHKPVYNYRQLEHSIAHSARYRAELLEINTAIFSAWDRFMAAYGQDGRYVKPYYANVIRRFKATLGAYFFAKDNPKSVFRQFKELKLLLHTSPYREAIKYCDRKKLHNRYDMLLCSAARINSAVCVFALFKLSVLGKMLRKRFSAW